MAQATDTVGLVDLPDSPFQPSAGDLVFPKCKFGESKPVFRSFQPLWIKKWLWIHYDAANDRVFCFTCARAVRQGSVSVTGRSESVFVSRGYTNWKDATGDKKGEFAMHERSQVKLIVS